MAQLDATGKIRVAMIGGGINSAVGRVHEIAMKMDGRFDLLAGCFSRNADNNRLSGQQYGVASERVYESAEQLLAAEASRIDAVVIATPIQAHAAQIGLSLEHGLRVISDKPLVGDIAECQALQKRLSAEGGEIFCIFNYTGYPAVRELRQRVRSGEIGHVFKVMAEMPQDSYMRLKNQGRVNAIQEWRLRDGAIGCVTLDLFVHLHSLVNFVCGNRAETVTAWSRSISGVAPGLADEVDAIVHYEDGLVLNAWYGKVALGYRNGLRLRVFGERGSLQWHQEDPELLLAADAEGNRRLIDRISTDSTVTTEPRYQRFKAGHPAGFIEAFANYYFDVAEVIRGAAAGPAILPFAVVEEGLRVSDAIHRSSASGGSFRVT